MKIRVLQLPLFKCLPSGDIKMEIFVSTRLEILEYTKDPIFIPKMPQNANDMHAARREKRKQNLVGDDQQRARHDNFITRDYQHWN